MEGNKATKKIEREMKSGTASLVLLSILAKAEEPLYGYLIAKQMEAGSESGSLIKQGTMSPMLRSLESSRLLESRVEPFVAGRPRRYYQITALGRQHGALAKALLVGGQPISQSGMWFRESDMRKLP
jgi:PadR family transcriptional regulator PadR